MQLPNFVTRASSPEVLQNLTKLEMAQAIGGVALPDKSIDPVVLDIHSDERPAPFEKWPVREGDQIAEKKVDEDLHRLNLKDWRTRNNKTESILTGIVNTSFGLNSGNLNKVNDYDWARRYDAELSLIKRDYPNPKPIKPGTEVK